jgi:hypothetical protein
MPRRMRDALAALAVTGALAGGAAVVAQAATSGGSSTTTTPKAAPNRAPRAAPPAQRPKGSHPCPHMGSGSNGASDPSGSSGGYSGT